MPDMISELINVTKYFGKQPAIRDLSLKIRQFEFTALLGPSGCGKSSTLRMLAGFDDPDSGCVKLHGKQVSGTEFQAPERRNIGMVFQDLALFPHLNVMDNIAFGLTGRGLKKRKRVQELLSLVGLTGLGRKMPHELSGGQQQRVAVARALAPRPELILMDEPFSSLDYQLRQQLRKDLQEIFRKEKVTVILVTHDCQEAFSFADRIILMKEGRIVQEGTPFNIYHKPLTPWTASFVGSANIMQAKITRDSIHSELGCFNHENGCRSGSCFKMVRPEDLGVNKATNGASDGTVQEIDFMGEHEILTIQLKSGSQVQAKVPAGQGWQPEQSVLLQTKQFHLFSPDQG